MLPETGYLRLSQIIGQREVTPAEAKKNKEIADKNMELAKNKEATENKEKVGPCSPRPYIPAIVPWSKSKLWDAVKKGEFPAPIKLSPGTTAWTIESIKEFCVSKSWKQLDFKF